MAGNGDSEHDGTTTGTAPAAGRSPEEGPLAVRCRGVRGATVATENSRGAIRDAILELIEAVVAANDIDPDDLASATFTTTPDLDAAFPAEAVRHMGWEYVPMLGAVEMAKPGAPEHCIRVLLHWNTVKGPREISHVYLRGMHVLRTAGDALEGEAAGDAKLSTNTNEGPT